MTVGVLPNYRYIQIQGHKGRQANKNCCETNSNSNYRYVRKRNEYIRKISPKTKVNSPQTTNKPVNEATLTRERKIDTTGTVTDDKTIQTITTTKKEEKKKQLKVAKTQREKLRRREK